MAIKSLQVDLAERGKIKIGDKSQEKKETSGGKKMAQPLKLDHFIITTMQKDAADRFIPDIVLMNRLKKEQGVDKLKEIPIRLLYDNNELNFITGLSCYKKTFINGKERLGCWCSGDNEKALRLNEKGEYEEINCPCERLGPFYSLADKCKYIGTLQCLIEGTNRVGGVWRFRTTGKNSVKSIIASMNMIKTLTGGGQTDSEDNPLGPLAWIPLKMIVSPKSTISPSGQPVLIYVVHLEFDGLDDRLTELGYEIMRKRIEHGMNMGRLQKQAQRLLVAPLQEDEVTQSETAKEFFPEAVTDVGFEQPPGHDDDPRVRATVGEGTAQKPAAASKKAAEDGEPPLSTDTSTENLAAESSKGQDEGIHKREPMTIPKVIEACHDNKIVPVFPVPLITTKGVAIGEWVDREMDKMGLHTNKVVFEMLPEMTKETRLTKDQITKLLSDAGYKVKFQEPGTMKKAQEEAFIPSAEQIPNKNAAANSEPLRLF